jgi:hypothetical protein
MASNMEVLERESVEFAHTDVLSCCAFSWTEELMPIGMPMRLEVLGYITIIKAETSSKSA